MSISNAPGECFKARVALHEDTYKVDHFGRVLVGKHTERGEVAGLLFFRAE